MWLDASVALPVDGDVVAVVKFTNRNWSYPIAADRRGIHETGRTYMSHDGVTWLDLGSLSKNSVAIRLRVAHQSIVPSPPGPPSPLASDRIGVFRPSSRLWYVDTNGDGSGVGEPFFGPFGQPGLGDIPVVGDWNGDGYGEFGVWRTSDRKWYLDYNGSGVWDSGADKALGPYGSDGDVPIVGRWRPWR